MMADDDGRRTNKTTKSQGQPQTPTDSPHPSSSLPHYLTTPISTPPPPPPNTSTHAVLGRGDLVPLPVEVGRAAENGMIAVGLELGEGG